MNNRYILLKTHFKEIIIYITRFKNVCKLRLINKEIKQMIDLYLVDTINNNRIYTYKNLLNGYNKFHSLLSYKEYNIVIDYIKHNIDKGNFKWQYIDIYKVLHMICQSGYEIENIFLESYYKKEFYVLIITDNGVYLEEDDQGNAYDVPICRISVAINTVYLEFLDNNVFVIRSCFRDFNDGKIEYRGHIPNKNEIINKVNTFSKRKIRTLDI